jgi:hypothetical protein
MGMALKRMTHDEDFEDKKDEEEKKEERSLKHLNDPEWDSFCKGRLQYFETKWTKKLETYTQEDHLNEEERVTT